MVVEIVGAKIGSTILNNLHDIAKIIESNRSVKCEWLTRDQMRFMSSFDLGPNWALMANGPTLFLIDDDGAYQSASSKEEIANHG